MYADVNICPPHLILFDTNRPLDTESVVHYRVIDKKPPYGYNEPQRT